MSTFSCCLRMKSTYLLCPTRSQIPRYPQLIPPQSCLQLTLSLDCQLLFTPHPPTLFGFLYFCMSLQWCIAKKTMDELHCWCYSVARTCTPYTAVGHFASSRKHIPVFQLVVLICHQINDLTDRVLPVGVLSWITSHHGVSPFASFPAYKYQNSPFRILLNIRSLIFAVSFSISPDSQTCGSIV